jgi:triacylglycerol esterase/lipase EstA (alpha/beta hydrolase family)
MIAGALASFAAVVLVFHGATYLLWTYESRRAGACGAAAAISWRAWLGEALALSMVVITWPFGVFRRRRPVPTSSSRPVVLIHGWSLNRASMFSLAARLRRDGRSAVTINYPSLGEDAETKSRAVAEEIRRISGWSPDGLVDVVAHGLGGVLVRAAARDPNVRRLLGNVVTLGSPHHGTMLALLGKRFGSIQVRPGSHFLTRLADEDHLADAVNLATIASPFDAIVFPTDTAHWKGALNITVDGLGHHALLYSKRVYTLLRENLDVPLRQAAA